MSKAAYIQAGKTIDYTNNGSTAIAYGSVIPLVTRIGVAGETIAVGAAGSVNVTGIYEIPAVNTAAFNVGDQLYWDNTNGVLTKTAAGNIPAGWCTEPKATAAALARVNIG